MRFTAVRRSYADRRNPNSIKQAARLAPFRRKAIPAVRRNPNPIKQAARLALYRRKATIVPPPSPKTKLQPKKRNRGERKEKIRGAEIFGNFFEFL